VLAIRIALAPPAPRIFERAGDLQRFLGLLVIRLELVEADRPVAAVAEHRLALEPLRPPAQRDHRVMDCAPADSAPAIVRSELDRVGAAGDPVVGPVEAA